MNGTDTVWLIRRRFGLGRFPPCQGDIPDCSQHLKAVICFPGQAPSQGIVPLSRRRGSLVRSL
jgi:hypothetical protein